MDLIWEFDRHGSSSLVRELWWLLRKGHWCACWNGRNDRIIGACRLWYDGPHWALHLGVWSCSVSAL
jgi:hypothetical protein